MVELFKMYRNRNKNCSIFFYFVVHFEFIHRMNQFKWSIKNSIVKKRTWWLWIKWSVNSLIQSMNALQYLSDRLHEMSNDSVSLQCSQCAAIVAFDNEEQRKKKHNFHLIVPYICVKRCTQLKTNKKITWGGTNYQNK